MTGFQQQVTKYQISAKDEDSDDKEGMSSADKGVIKNITSEDTKKQPSVIKQGGEKGEERRGSRFMGKVTFSLKRKGAREVESNDVQI